MFGPESRGQTTYPMEQSRSIGSCVLLLQDSAGTNSTRDASIIDPNILSTSTYVHAMVDCLRDYWLSFFTKGLIKEVLPPGNINPYASDEDLRTFVVNNIDTNHHPVGTCKVGSDSNELAVVDKIFLVQGMSNSLASGGCMPPGYSPKYPVATPMYPS